MPIRIDDLLVTATAHLASDLHLKVGSFPVMRIGGELYPIADAPRLSPDDTLDMAFSMMSNRQKQKLKEVSEVDIAYSVKSLGRFRAAIKNAQSVRAMNNLPAEIQKDIGWPVSPRNDAHANLSRLLLGGGR